MYSKNNKFNTNDSSQDVVVVKHEIIDEDALVNRVKFEEEKVERDTLKYESKHEYSDLNAFSMALKAVIQTACDKIISSPNDLIGVVFYGSKSKNNVFNFDNIYVHQTLDIPEANRIKDLELMMKKGVSPFGSCAENLNEFTDMSKVLWICQNLFSTVPSNVGSKRVFLFTNQEDPTRGDSDLRNQCIERATTLVESDILLDVFALVAKEDSFNQNKFWNHIVSGELDEYSINSSIHKIDNVDILRKCVRSKEFKKRSLCNLNMSIGEMDISVNLYNLIQKAKKSSSITLNAETNTRLYPETKYICEDTSKDLMPNEIGKYFEYGTNKVSFSPEEILNIKRIIPVGIQILGFKSINRLKPYHSVGSSGFIYPNDFKIKNSSVAFSALYKKMIEKKVFALSRIKKRENGTYILAALLPQKEIIGDETQIEPPGLHVITLPFADNIRSFDFPERDPQITENQISMFQKIVKSIRIDYSSSIFENPSIQKHFASLQALALEHRELDPVVDYIEPDYEGMKKYKTLIDDARNSVYLDSFKSDIKPSKRKREDKETKDTKNKKRKVKEEIDS